MPFRLRSRLAVVRDAFDRLRHPARHLAARDRLDALNPGSLLFVCLGNVCRSPYAEWRAREQFTDRGMIFDSAGFIGPGRNPPEAALEAASMRGIDHGENISQVVTRELAERFDAVFLFQQSHARKLRKAVSGLDRDRVFQLGDFDPQWTGKRAIVDPWGKPLEEFQVTFARIDRCLEAIEQTLTGT